ncbi:carboxypeptidase B-like [Liolophura sinensis]|uniref:carboxypeptidase B-like n=1 Tax=Liolophura sinensis TaxID=3198878 RepID=UPI003158117A
MGVSGLRSGRRLDFWSDARSPGSPAIVRVPPSRRSETWKQLVLRGMLPEVTIADVQRAIELEPVSLDQDLHTQAARLLPLCVNLQITGVSRRSRKPGFFLSAGMHAREWIAPATLIYIAGQLIEQYGNNTAVTQLVDSMEWVILPVFNVDGYTYTWTTDRLWRKTRSRQNNETCVGVDPNRNWDWKWCEKGASKDPCSPIYCGPSVTSEPEVKGVADFLAAVPGRFKAYVDFHGFLQIWLSPWGHSRAFPRWFIFQRLCSNEAVRAITAVHGTKYRQGTTALTLYVISGAGMDWAYGVAKIPYAVTVELRDTGKYGFLLPANQIIPSGEETLQGIIAMARYVIRYS